MKTKYELKKLSDWWFDLSKITLGSLVLKLFEPGEIRFTLGSFLISLTGLILVIGCASVGLKFARKVKGS